MRLIKLMVLVVIASFAAPSAWADHRANSVAGALIGGALGGFLGSKVGKGSGKLAATAAGTVLGAFVGGSLAAPAHAAYPKHARIRPYGHYGAPRGRRHGVAAGPYDPPPPITWYPPPRPAPRAPYCREYTRTVYIGEKTANVYGTACWQPDGSWRIANQSLY